MRRQVWSDLSPHFFLSTFDSLAGGADQGSRPPATEGENSGG
jgi:hypothetical protein